MSGGGAPAPASVDNAAPPTVSDVMRIGDKITIRLTGVPDEANEGYIIEVHRVTAALLAAFTQAGGELLFNLLTERYERRSVIVTTNLAFAEWVKVFGGDEKLTTALLDRLAHHATVIATKGKSFRMRKKGLTERTIEDQTTTDALPKAGRKA